MGFGGGGGGALPAHVHNSVPLQGGPLDFANDTIASLNVGSTTFSDGAALQELLLGNAGDSLVVNGAGTAPEWAAGSAGAYTFLGSDRLTVAGSSLSVNFAAQTGDTTGSVICFYNLISLAASPYTQTEITVNNISGGAPSYTTQFCRMSGGAGTFTTGSGTNNILLPTGQRVTSGFIEFTSSTPQQDAAGQDTAIGYNGSDRGESVGRGATTYGGTLSAGVSALTEITSVELDATSGNWGIGSQMSVFASKI